MEKTMPNIAQIFCEVGKVKKPFDERELLRLIDVLNKSGVPLSGGNCGQSSFGLEKYIFDNYKVSPKDLTIGIATGDLVSETFEDLLTEEFDLYHAFVEYKGNKYDETGKIDDNYLIRLASEQYNNPNPMIINGLPFNEKTRRILSGNTGWDNDWTAYYNILKRSA